jgi:nucleotide-binding universal stress UspA family protein
MLDSPLRLLVPLDGSPASETVLAAIMPLVRSQSTSITLFRAVEPDQSSDPVREYLSKARKALQAQGLSPDVAWQWGPPAREILYLAHGGLFDLVAMSTHGNSGVRRLLMGSVTEEVLRETPIPVLVCRPGSWLTRWNRILVGLDGSPAAEQILPEAVLMAKRLGATLHVISVAPPAVPSSGYRRTPFLYPEESPQPYLRDVCRRLAAEGVMCVTEPREGRAASEIVRYAGEVGAGLIALTTHGRTGLARAVLGSVAEEVVRTAPCPVLVRKLLPVASAVHHA